MTTTTPELINSQHKYQHLRSDRESVEDTRPEKATSSSTELEAKQSPSSMTQGSSLSSFAVSKRFLALFQLEKFNSIIGARRLTDIQFKEESNQIAAVVVEQELYRLLYEKQQILRRQSELIHYLETMFLDEQSRCIKNELAEIQSKAEADRNDSFLAMEKELTERCTAIINERDMTLTDMDVERLRHAEEDEELATEIEYRHKIWFEETPFPKTLCSNGEGILNNFDVSLTGSTNDDLCSNLEDKTPPRFGSLPQIRLQKPHTKESSCAIS